MCASRTSDERRGEAEQMTIERRHFDGTWCENRHEGPKVEALIKTATERFESIPSLHMIVFFPDWIRISR